jgi:hypothetical protein
MQNAWKAQRDVPPVTPLAIEISKARNAKGFTFAGPTTATVIRLDASGPPRQRLHRCCFRHAEIKRLGRSSSREIGTSRNCDTLPCTQKDIQRWPKPSSPRIFRNG